MKPPRSKASRIVEKTEVVHSFRIWIEDQQISKTFTLVISTEYRQWNQPPICLVFNTKECKPDLDELHKHLDKCQIRWKTAAKLPLGLKHKRGKKKLFPWIASLTRTFLKCSSSDQPKHSIDNLEVLRTPSPLSEKNPCKKTVQSHPKNIPWSIYTSTLTRLIIEPFQIHLLDKANIFSSDGWIKFRNYFWINIMASQTLWSDWTASCETTRSW